MAASRTDLKKSQWEFQTSTTGDLLSLIEQHSVSLKQITREIFQGIASGKDDVFYLSKERMNQHKLELEVVKPLLKGKDIKRYFLHWSETFVLYPYDDHSRVIPETKFSKQFPNAYEYLCANRDLLSGRGYFESSSKAWYELWNQRKKANFEATKIVTPEISDRNHFARTTGYFGNTKTYNIIPSNSSEAFCCYLVAVLNSSVIQYYYQSITTPQAGGFFAYKTKFLERIPIRLADSINIERFAILVPLVELAYRSQQHVQFFDDLIDACVMECYFPEHMVERDLLLLDDLAPYLSMYNSKVSESKQMEFLDNLYSKLNAPQSPVRNRLLRLTADSPDLLAVIKAGGKM